MNLCFTALLLSLTGKIAAFAPLTLTARSTTRLHVTIGDDDGDATKNDAKSDDSNGIGDAASFDLERTRQRLENLILNTGDETQDFNSGGNAENCDGETNSNTSPPFSFAKILADFGNGADFSMSSFPPSPPLSSTERDRRLSEIRLLEYLVEGDDAVSALWNHWYSERGSRTKACLDQIGGLLTNPEDWDECEGLLIELVDEHGIHFVEPVNLLATLYFLQGKLELSYKLCQIVLTQKPYHIGALSGIVQVALGLNDPIASRDWAHKRLPRPSSGEGLQRLENPQRVEWVKNAVAKAKELLEQADRRTKEDFFGKPETYYGIDDNEGAGIFDNAEIFDTSGFFYPNDENDGSAWQ